MRAIVNRLTYANVVATLALIVALGGGVAYAADTIFSSDIVDGEVKTADVATGAVRSAEIANNQVRSPDVRELNSFFEASSDTGSCGSDDHLPESCADSTITLDRPGKLLLNATGEWGHVQPRRPGGARLRVR